MRSAVDHGVYVPRWQSQQLALRAAERLPAGGGIAVDLCTGTGAIAAVLRARRPEARVMATEIDQRAIACARSNGIEVFEGDLLDPLPPALERRVDVIVGVVPYVPTPELGLLQRDTFTFETALSYDGGDDGTAHLRRAIAGAPRFLRPGGALLLELGAGQPERLQDDLTAMASRMSPSSATRTATSAASKRRTALLPNDACRFGSRSPIPEFFLGRASPSVARGSLPPSGSSVLLHAVAAPSALVSVGSLRASGPDPGGADSDAE